MPLAAALLSQETPEALFSGVFGRGRLPHSQRPRAVLGRGLLLPLSAGLLCIDGEADGALAATEPFLTLLSPEGRMERRASLWAWANDTRSEICNLAVAMQGDVPGASGPNGLEYGAFHPETRRSLRLACSGACISVLDADGGGLFGVSHGAIAMSPAAAWGGIIRALSDEV